jgi:hypothetical protein
MKPIHYILLILTGLLLITGISSFVLFKLWRNSTELADQRYENMYQTLNLRDQQIVLQTQQELEQLIPEMKLLIDSLNLKHITHVHQTNYHYSTDSIVTILIPLPSDSVTERSRSTLPRDSIAWYQDTLPRDSSRVVQYSFSIDTACLSISGIVTLPRDATTRLSRVVPSASILFSNISFNDQITTFYFWQRQRLFNWSWTPKWGRKQYRAQTHSNCTDSISTLDIQIQKY